MASVFITGICGFLGCHLARALKAEGHNVSGADNLLGGDATNLLWDDVAWHEEDCCDQGAMRFLMDLYQPEVVYMTAAAPHEGLSVFSPAIVTQHTYRSTVATASAALSLGSK